MRKLIYSMSVSLDGYVETRDRKLDWVIVDKELHNFFNDQSREMGAFLYGRRAYELMAEYWPTGDADPAAPAVEADFARIWRAMPKVVFSKSLDRVDWNSRLVRDHMAAEITKLKLQSGGDLGIAGATIASAAMRLGLIDEYWMFVNPVVLGEGLPLFPDLHTTLKLNLVESRTFATGVVYLRYEPDAQSQAQLQSHAHREQERS